MRVNAILSVSLLAVLHVAWFSAEASAAAVGQNYLGAKGFVTGKTATSLTLLMSNKRVLVVVTNNTRVLGQRDSFAAIVPNDVVRAEGRTVGNRLLADRIDVVFAADSLKVQPPPKGPTIEFLTFRI